MTNEIEQANLSFGIQDTSEMGIGNSALLSDLLSPETSTTDPDKVVDINTPDDKKPDPPATPEKPIVTKDGKPEEKPDDYVNPLDSFLDDELLDSPDDKPESNTNIGGADGKSASTVNSSEGKEKSLTGTEERSQFEALANDLFELGVFSKDSDDEVPTPIKTPEEFLEKFNSEKRKGAMEMVDNFIGQFGTDYQEAFDAIYVKGINPKEYFTAFNKIEEFSNLDLTIEANQEKVVRQALLDQGFEPEDATAEIEKLKNYGDLEITSQRHHKVLIKKEAAALQQKTLEAQAEQNLKAQSKQIYAKNVNTVLQDKLKEKTFDGIPLNPKLARELQDFLLVDKWKTDKGETLTDFDRYILELKRPENHANKVKVALLLKMLETDPSLSTIQKSGVSKKTDTLFKEVSRQVTNSNNKTASSSSWFNK